MILLFQLYGFNINFAKSVLTPSTRSTYQGFETDTVQMKYYCSLDKETKYKNFISDILQFHDIHGYVPARDLAGVLGKLNSLSRSHGSICRIMLRNCQNSLGKAVQVYDWNGNVILTVGLVELTFFLENISNYNGTNIPNSRISSYTVKQEQISDMVKNIILTDTPLNDLLVTDASEKSVFMYYNGTFHEVLDYDFDEHEQKFSSGRRELMGLYTFLLYCQANKKTFPSGIIYWQTDSSNCFYYLTRGSRNLQNQELLLKVINFFAFFFIIFVVILLKCLFFILG